ncbi:oxidoreductase [Stagonosporopsis vannaccii]|nr:oxidoreductase [Stagonosporopsis vannaccii]
MRSYTQVHQNLQGAGDSRPTAMQIIEDYGLTGKLEGKVALITGVSSGIGVETARALKATGMHVFGAVRNLEKAKTALENDLEPDRLELLKLDINSLTSVRACVQNFLAKGKQLNFLILNAGIMITPEGKTEDGFELQFGINHLAHFLLFQLLKPALLASATPAIGSRIIALSSSAHRGGQFDFSNSDDINFISKPYDPIAAYAQSKLAPIYMANEIERRYGNVNLHGLSVMPGGIWTGLQASLPEAVKSTWKGDAEFMKAFKSPEQGAATTVWGVVATELEGKGAKYLEDCAVAALAPAPTGDPTADMGAPGYAAWAFDEAKEKALWKISCEMVRVHDE